MATSTPMTASAQTGRSTGRIVMGERVAADVPCTPMHISPAYLDTLPAHLAEAIEGLAPIWKTESVWVGAAPASFHFTAPVGVPGLDFVYVVNDTQDEFRGVPETGEEVMPGGDVYHPGLPFTLPVGTWLLWPGHELPAFPSIMRAVLVTDAATISEAHAQAEAAGWLARRFYEPWPWEQGTGSKRHHPRRKSGRHSRER